MALVNVLLLSGLVLCHSHASKSRKTVNIDIDVPRSGPVCVLIETGATVRFHWDQQHNLYELNSEASYQQCNFQSASKLAGAGPREDGLSIVVGNAPEDRFFACSKICSRNGHKVRLCIRKAGEGGQIDRGSCSCSEGTLYDGDVSYAKHRWAYEIPCMMILVMFCDVFL
eukprot:gnl/MRDRNA2_/MRDRNA2_101026_c0_seq1.p1 gnl/MRDRNA2_/MRDRNA2_101026_c0~~gnl/MRDRNA2_/MRDRNA2_101026_c0_seq1.p1  ORF type:complete len:170 (-),score=17.06 gnl/MRDRNA2_/MRDRNA2_101026_c0_seq1:48-557(-)